MNTFKYILPLALSVCWTTMYAQRLEEELGDTPLQPGQTIELDGVTYVAGVNLITNPSFNEIDADGNYPGWTSGTYQPLNSQFFTRNTEGGYDEGVSITATQNTDAATEGAIATRWRVTPYTKYYFSYQMKGGSSYLQYCPVLTLTDINSTAGGQNEGPKESTMLIGCTDYNEGMYGFSTYSDPEMWNLTALSFDSDKDVFLQFNARYLYNDEYDTYTSFDDFRLMQLYPVEDGNAFETVKTLFKERYAEVTAWADSCLAEKYSVFYDEFTAQISEYDITDIEDAETIQYYLNDLEEAFASAKAEYAAAEAIPSLIEKFYSLNTFFENNLEFIVSCEGIYSNIFTDAYGEIENVMTWWEDEYHGMGQHLTYYNILINQLHPYLGVDAVVRLHNTLEATREDAKPEVVAEAEKYLERLKEFEDSELLYNEIPTIEDIIKRLLKVYKIRIHMESATGTFAVRLANLIDSFDDAEWLLVTGMMNKADCETLGKLKNLKFLDLSGITSMEIGSMLNLRVDSLSNTMRPDVSIVTGGQLSFLGTDTLSMGHFSMTLDHTGNINTLVNNGIMGAENVTLRYKNTNQQWDFVSFPFNVKMADIKPMYDNQDICIREYSGENRAAGDMDNTWIDVTPEATLKAGQGYIIQSPMRYGLNGNIYNYSAWTVPAVRDAKMNDIFRSEDVTVELEIHATDDTFAHNRSWNLIGNPFPSYFGMEYFDFDGPIIRWNGAQKTYYIVEKSDAKTAYLKPGEAFFLQRPIGDESSVTFRAEGRMVALPLLKKSKAQASDSTNQLDITITDGTYSDNTLITLTDDALLQYEIGHDAVKFMSPEKDVAQIYSHDIETAGSKSAQVNYSLNERPMANGTVKLGIYIPAEGEYTLSIGEGNAILEDTETGSFIQLNAETSYTFSAKTGTYDSRFIIHLNSDATGIADINTSSVTGDNTYNLAGQRVNTNAKGLVISKGQKVMRL